MEHKQIANKLQHLEHQDSYAIISSNEYFALGIDLSAHEHKRFAVYEQDRQMVGFDDNDNPIAKYNLINPTYYSNMTLTQWSDFSIKYDLTPISSKFSALYGLIEPLENKNFYRRIDISAGEKIIESLYFNDEKKYIEELDDFQNIGRMSEIATVDITKEEYQQNEMFKNTQENAGYYILAESKRKALGFSPTAPSAIVIWDITPYGDYVNGQYGNTLNLFEIADLRFRGMDIDGALSKLESIGFDWRETMAAETESKQEQSEFLQKITSKNSHGGMYQGYHIIDSNHNYGLGFNPFAEDGKKFVLMDSTYTPRLASKNKEIDFLSIPKNDSNRYFDSKSLSEWDSFCVSHGFSFEYLNKFFKDIEYKDCLKSDMENIITQNETNQLVFKQSPTTQSQLQIGNIISVPVQFPGVEHKNVRTMLITDKTENGDYICNNLTSKKPYKDNDKFQGNVYVAASDENGLKYDSYVKCDKQYFVPADTPELRNTKAHLTDEALSAVKATTDRLQDIQSVHIANNPSTEISIDENINNILTNFKTDPELFSEFTAFSAQFYDYSFTNKLHIFNQAPHSTFVASYTHWQELGYNVLRGEKGVTIYRPIEISTFNRQGENIPIKQATNEEKAKIGRGEIKVDTQTNFVKHNVFDISQTTCPKEDYPKVYSMGYADIDKLTMYETVKDFAETSGFTIKEEPLQSIALNGYCDVEHSSITINSRLEDSEKLSTMLHELAHGLMHKTSTQDTPVMEFEAEALSITLQHKFNLPVDDSSKNYLCNYYKKIDKNNFKADQSFSRLSKAAKFVDKGVNARFAEKGISLEQSKNISIDKQGFSQQTTSALSNQNFLQEL